MMKRKHGDRKNPEDLVEKEKFLEKKINTNANAYYASTVNS
jgi:hypothetical protein